MKRKKLPVLSAACAGMTLFASCGMFYQPVKEYFSEYTETAAVVSWSADGSYPADSGGVTCLPSGNTRTVTLTLRNPQHYTFNLTGSSLPDAAAAECTILTSEGERALSVTQDASDTTTIYASFPDALLTAMEKGGDISLTLRMVEPKSGRSFDSYTVPLHANSAPPDVSGAVVYTDSSTNTYVVCFYMPRKEKLASTGIHSDITSLTINGTVYPVALTDSGTFTFTSGSGVLLQTKPADTIVQNNVVFADKTVPPFYMQPVYFMSGDTVSADNTTYTLTLTDKMGLTSSIKTSVKAVQLGQVTVTDSSGRTLSGGDELSQDDGSSYSTVTISPPAVTTFTGSDGNTTTYDTSDASVIYEVYKTDGTTTTLLFDGKSIHGTATIQLPAGQIELYAYARKSLFADAAPVELGCTILTTRAYVNPDYTGTSTGSRDYPFITITDAVTALSDKTSSANTITLLGNVTSAQNASHSGTVLYLTPGDFTDSSGAACTAL
ncbi:MAG: hypothetical protein M0P01_15545, partial [Treponema sp.]|nr:hypothetical protein [Treponema sp.]